MRTVIVAVVAVVLTFSAGAGAQDPPEETLDLDPTAHAAWARSGAAPGEQVDTESESAAFARIHDADADLLELEAAQRMVGFDLMDGVKG